MIEYVARKRKKRFLIQNAKGSLHFEIILPRIYPSVGSPMYSQWIQHLALLDNSSQIPFSCWSNLIKLGQFGYEGDALKSELNVKRSRMSLFIIIGILKMIVFAVFLISLNWLFSGRNFLPIKVNAFYLLSMAHK